MRRCIVAVLAVLTVALLAGCGIPVEQEPRPLPTGTTSPTNAAGQTSTPAPDDSGATLWFVRGGRLVPVTRTVTGPLSSQDYIDLLVDGPTKPEQDAGMRSSVVSVVTGEPLVVTAKTAGVATAQAPPDEVAVVLRPAFKDLLSQEQVLVLGEVVITLAVDQVSKVLFVDKDGQALGVPTADGRLANGPVTPQDYAALVE